MKVCICIPGPLRSFSRCWESILRCMIKPLEEKVGKGNVKIYMENFHVSEEFYKKEFDKNMFNTKMEIDTSGWQKILNTSKYIEYSNLYEFRDAYIENIFKQINEKNETDWDVYDLKKYVMPFQKMEKSGMEFKHYYNFVQGLCMNYNNKILIDKIPNEYDIIIKMRGDTKFIWEFPVVDALKSKNNFIYTAAGNRWDNFFWGRANTVKSLYENFFTQAKAIIEFWKLGGINEKLRLGKKITMSPEAESHSNAKYEDWLFAPEGMLLYFITKQNKKIVRSYFSGSRDWDVERNLPNGLGSKYKSK